MFEQIELLFLLFITYSVIGWCIEIVVSIYEQKKIINRGFLIGPYCPIYGVGAVMIITFLEQYKSDLIVLFCMSVILSSILEYLTSFVMEKLFKARWWDYSKKRFNINGRICLETIIPFGVLGCIAVYIVNPFFLSIYNQIPIVPFHLIVGFLLGIFLLDCIVSCNIILSFRKVASTIRRDNTEEITRKVRKVLASKSLLTKRLIIAFPNVQATIGKLSKKHYIFKRDRIKHEKKKKKNF